MTTPTMLTGSRLVIYVDGVAMAYAQSLSFSDRMAVAPVGGIGSYSYDALEPLQYSASGSMVITEYSQAAWDAIDGMGKSVVKNERAQTTTGSNSLLRGAWYSPVSMMSSSTFDIKVYSRAKQSALAGVQGANAAVTDLLLRYSLNDCRMNSYAVTFTPGSLVQENIGFMCLTVIDEQYESV